MADPDEQRERTASAPGPRAPEVAGDAPAASARRHRWVSAVLAATALLAALVFGVTTAKADSSLGPHEATYAVTTDGTVTVDVGPLGTLQIDSPLPLRLGVRVTVREIPASFTELDPASTLQALSADAQGYVQFFSAPQATLHDVTRALLVDVLMRTAAAIVVVGCAWWAGRGLMGESRRAQLADALWRHRGQAAAATAVVLVLGATLTSSGARVPEPEVGVAASPVFDGTPLEGARITGRLGGVLDTYGGYVVQAYRENEEFYARADAALVAALDAQDVARRESEAFRATLTGLLPSATRSSAPARDLRTLVVVSDLHCNVGMAPLVTTLVERSGATVVLDAGDTTMNGTSVEQYCVTTFARAVPSGVALVTSPGNHDSAETSRSYARAGATVLSGTTVSVRGLRILGDHDPNQTRVGGGTTTAAGESLDEEAVRLADAACDDMDGVDLLLVHDPAVGGPSAASGCVPAQISGHLHVRQSPLVVGRGIRYVSSSTAGARLGEPTIGPLRGTAELTVLRWDATTRAFLDYQVVEVHADATVRLLPRTPWPTVPASPPEVQGVP